MAGTSKIRRFCVTTTAGEDETSEGNPENSKRDAVDVAPSVPAPGDEAAAEPTTAEPATVEPARRGPVVQALHLTLEDPTDVGLSSVRPDRGPKMRYCLCSGVSRGFSGCPESPLSLHDFFYQGGDTVTGTDLHLPLTFTSFGNPP